MNKINLDDNIPKEQKEFIIRLFSDVFNACFANDIEDCTTFQSLKRLIFRNAEDIGSYLDLDIVDEFEQDRKDQKIERLEYEVDDLMEQLSKYESGSLLDEWKGEILQRYLPNFTPLELEQRLKS